MSDQNKKLSKKQMAIKIIKFILNILVVGIIELIMLL